MNRVTTADAYVYTADTDRQKNCHVEFPNFQIKYASSRRELVGNSIHTAWRVNGRRDGLRCIDDVWGDSLLQIYSWVRRWKNVEYLPVTEWVMRKSLLGVSAQ